MFSIASNASSLPARYNPVVVVQRDGQNRRRAIAGKLENHRIEGNRAVWTYAGVNGSRRLTVTWRFEENGLWIEPVTYESSANDDIVSLNLFALRADDSAKPALDTDDLVLPGICESAAVSPIMDSEVGANLRTSLGRAGTGVTQQWALPCHFFAGFRAASGGTADTPDDTRSVQGFCCGLTDLPNADLYLDQNQGRASLVFDYRSDLWGHMRGPAKFQLGAGLFWAFAPNYREAIRGYYRGLLDAGIVRKKVNSARKNATLLSPQWCTWGEQMALKKEGTALEEGSQLDQASLEKCYADFKASGLRASLFSIDDGWEGTYGSLEHAENRFPNLNNSSLVSVRMASASECGRPSCVAKIPQAWASLHNKCCA